MQIDWFNLAWEIFPYLFVSIVGIWIFYTLQKIWIRYNRVKRLKKGKDAEKDAQRLLQKRGYTIHDYQPQLSYNMLVSNERKSIQITPDFIAAKGSLKYVVEVKSGDVATNPLYGNTRRQILEYAMVSEMPLLFVDMTNEEIHEIKFPFGPEKNRVNWWKYLSWFFILVISTTLFGMAISSMLKFL